MSREGPPLPPDRFEEVLREKAPAFGLRLSGSSLQGLSRYLSELDAWRRKTNLVGRLSADELCEHALESVMGSELIAHGERVVDIGPGAGFPGLAIAICRPDLSVTLVEPRARRAAFLRHVVRELSLGPRVGVFQGRIQEVGGQTFGVATTRAVGGTSSWLGSAGFLSPGGRLLAWTTEPEAMLEELPGFSLEREVAVPGSERRRIAGYVKLP